MTKREMIYCAGPYSPVMPATWTEKDKVLESPRIILANVNKAIQVGISVIERGHVPVIPHLTFFLHTAMVNPTIPETFWYDFDNVWLDRCDSILRYAHSFGADNEYERAKKKGLKLYNHVSEIPNLYTNGIKQDLIKVVYRSDLTKPTSTRLIAPRVVK